MPYNLFNIYILFFYCNQALLYLLFTFRNFLLANNFKTSYSTYFISPYNSSFYCSQFHWNFEFTINIYAINSQLACNLYNELRKMKSSPKELLIFNLKFSVGKQFPEVIQYLLHLFFYNSQFLRNFKFTINIFLYANNSQLTYIIRCVR